jgi:hypothetical protein
MNRQKPEGNKNGIAPGTQLPKPTKTNSKPEPQTKSPLKPKHAMFGPKIGDGPSVWQSLANILHDDDDHQ